MAGMWRSWGLIGLLAGLAVAQFPPKPEGLTLVQSKFHENVTLSFKKVCKHPLDLKIPEVLQLSKLISQAQTETCETTPGVKSYAGYVHLPRGFLDDGNSVEAQDYPINTSVLMNIHT